MFFDGWMTLGRTALVGTLAYLALVLLLRASGKRTLSKMNAFDFIVTVALGSTLATILLSSSVSLARGVLAFGLLILLQFVITWLSVRSPAVRRLVKAEPTLLVHKGEFLHGAMKQERVTEEEIRAALRSQGIPAVDNVEAVVLETAGDLSVIQQHSGEHSSSLQDVSGHPT
ncbi:MAG: DUF421 domain-containing protein [Actinomycetota bacterium]|nr:DUF421 domain-containing protein [Actinomycetota bacterium]